MQIEIIPLSQVKPYWRNPRDNEKAVEAVMQSIQDYGFNSPLILDAEYVIIAGHTRYKALMALGWDKAPCVIADLPQDKAKEYRIADNKTSELAEWDMDKLLPELRELAVEDMQIYFGEESLDDLITEEMGLKLEHSQPTQEKIDAADLKLQDTFKDRNSERQGDYVEVMCPGCGHEFFVQKAEINRQPGQAME